MSRIMIDIKDETKVEIFLTLINDLPYVDARIDHAPKKWKGNLSALNTPINIQGFSVFTRNELHER